jgi:hypothetical protein
MCVGLSRSSYAQSTSNVAVTGWIVDADSLNSLDAVNVFLLNSDKKVMQKTLSNEKGRFSFPEVPAGTYYIRTVLKGYRVMISKPFVIADLAQKYNYKLKIRKLQKGETDSDMNYDDWFEWFDDRDIIVNEK